MRPTRAGSDFHFRAFADNMRWFVLPDLVVRAVETDEELYQANDLMAKVHYLDYFEGARRLETCWSAYPGFRREHTRVAFWKDDLAASLRLTTDTIRIGEARLKMGGLGFVTTVGQFRNKGVGRELIQHTLQYMEDHNYHVSTLFGIANFYHRFGFIATLAEYATTVYVLEAQAAPNPPYRMRQGKPGDIRAIQKIHNVNDGEVACSLIRSAAHITSRWEDWKHVRVLTDDRGKVTAYFVMRTTESELDILEMGGVDYAACGAILHACAAVAAEECVSAIRFLAPPSHPLIRFLLQYRSTHETRIQRDQGGMMAFVNVGETLESMIPEWESALMRSAVRELKTEVTLLVDKKPYRVRANRGAVDVSAASGMNKMSVSAAELMHLMTGYRYLDEILSAQRRIITAEGRALLTAMFPKRTPYVWRLDRF